MRRPRSTSPYPRIVVAQPTRTSSTVLYDQGIDNVIGRSLDLGRTWQPWITPTDATVFNPLAATSLALYLDGYPGLEVARGGPTAHVVPALAGISVDQVLTTFAHPALAVALARRSPLGGLVAYVTRDAGATWQRLPIPVGTNCFAVASTLSPDGRLVTAFGDASTSLPGCRTASVVSTPLTR
jgi:hypothetical protein